MRRALALAVLGLSLFSFPALPQQAPTTGSIEGIVVRADTDQPIANAQVTLTQIAEVPTGAAAVIVPVTTGDDGKFAFRNLKPATYRVAATTESFIRVANGQRIPSDLGRLLFVEAGQSVTDAKIRVTPGGAITGRILDENGQPATGAPVQLIRVIYNNPQGKTYQGAGTATVDDRGVYRIFAVPPGRYFLTAGTMPSAATLVGLRANLTRFSLVYYPDVSGLDQAMAIEVKAGNEVSVNMRVKRETQTFHVRGRVVNPTGVPLPQNMTMMLGVNNFSGSSASSGRPDSFDSATGTFDVSNVPPGEFTIGIGQPLQAPQAQRIMGLAASAPIRVTTADIDGLVLTLTAGATVYGKVILEGQPVSAVPNLGSLRLLFRNALAPMAMGIPEWKSVAGQGFQVEGLRDGEYRIQMAGNVPGFYVNSVKYGDEDILGRTFNFRSGATGSFEVVLKAGTQTVSGKVTDSQSQPVSGIPVIFIPAQRGRNDMFRSVNTDQTGKFTIRDLAPGEYKVFSWEAADNTAYMDPDFLKQYEELGKTITVKESYNSSVDVKLIPAQ